MNKTWEAMKFAVENQVRDITSELYKIPEVSRRLRVGNGVWFMIRALLVVPYHLVFVSNMGAQARLLVLVMAIRRSEMV